MPKPILYGSTFSPFVRKVKVLLMEKGLDHELEQLNPFEKSREFLEMSPAGKIPVYRDSEGRIVNDSSIIVSYIGECHPDPPLMPKDPYLKARARWFEEYMDSVVAPNLVFPIFGQRIVNRYFLKQEPDEKVVAEAMQSAPQFFDYLESQIRSKEFFAADMFTVADISLASAMVNLHHADFPIDAQAYPHLAEWYEKIVTRPSFAEVVAWEKQALVKLKQAG